MSSLHLRTTAFLLLVGCSSEAGVIEPRHTVDVPSAESVPSAAARAKDEPVLVLTRDRYLDVRSGRSVARDRRNENRPTVQGRTVFFEDLDKLHARDLFPTKERWTARLPDDLWVDSIVVGDGAVYVIGTSPGRVDLAAFDEHTGKTLFVLPSVGHLGNWAAAGPFGLVIPKLDAPEGAVLVSPAGQLTKLPSPAPPNPLDLNGVKEPYPILMLTSVTTRFGPCVHYFQGDNTAVQCFGMHGERKWASPWQMGESGRTPMQGRVAATPTHLVLSTNGNSNYKDEQRSDVLRAQDGTSVGESRRDVVTPLEDAEGRLSLLYRRGDQIHLERDGARRWSLPYDQAGSGVIFAEQVGSDLVLAELPQLASWGSNDAVGFEVVRVDLATGVVRWRQKLSMVGEQLIEGALRLVVAGENLAVVLGRDKPMAALLKLDTGAVLAEPSF